MTRYEVSLETPLARSFLHHLREVFLRTGFSPATEVEEAASGVEVHKLVQDGFEVFLSLEEKGAKESRLVVESQREITPFLEKAIREWVRELLNPLLQPPELRERLQNLLKAL